MQLVTESYHVEGLQTATVGGDKNHAVKIWTTPQCATGRTPKWGSRPPFKSALEATKLMYRWQETFPKTHFRVVRVAMFSTKEPVWLSC